MIENHGERISVVGNKPNLSGGDYYHVLIKYADQSLFFDGWVDENIMPIIFGKDRESGYLPNDNAIAKDIYQKIYNKENIEFVKAKIEDKERIIDFRFQNYFDDGVNRISALAAFNQEYNDNHITFYAEVNGLIIGHIYAYFENEYGYIDHLFVHSNYRKLGLGKMLVYIMEKAMKTNNVKRIDLRIQDYKDKIIKNSNFWRIMGYKNIEESIPGYGLGLIIADLYKEI